MRHLVANLNIKLNYYFFFLQEFSKHLMPTYTIHNKLLLWLQKLGRLSICPLLSIIHIRFRFLSKHLHPQVCFLMKLMILIAFSIELYTVRLYLSDFLNF